ncbi:3-oxoadipate enol-lactonase [Streptomyces sp. NPDC047117]|uniref:bifunctional 3-oxoadipate enol-lactonase/4-carboxymuconolactone decarboxylase PcaDC n=1 Tax=Streptomyces sp. NPDC047117 TaxID=3155379 RepID=UPI0033F44A15
MTELPHHRLDGPQDAPPLILGPSIGTSLDVWEPQLAALTRTHRVLRWDLPGHGGSAAGLVSGEPAMADLARLVLGLADAQGWDTFAYAGISIGGAVGLTLAADHPERLTRLAVVCSSAHFGGADTWRERAALVRAEGTEAMAASRPGTWFAPEFAAAPRGQALIKDLLDTDPAGYAACCEALASYDVRDRLAGITVPTLVVAGREDPATPPAHAREIADAVPGASLTEVGGAYHLAGVDRPGPVTAALAAHFAPEPDAAAEAAGQPADDAGRRAAGMAVRRAVLGDPHVDRAEAKKTQFTARFQDFITRYAWGEIWTGSTLDRRTRSCITLTALIAHGHHAELAMHVRAAVRNGLTPEEIGEVILQSGIYCGVPAANTAFGIAQDVLAELE